MRRYDRAETLFFFDPPYWKTEGYGTDFTLEQHQLLAKAMAGMAGRAILTINDHPDMRRIYGDFHCEPVRTTYTIGGGARSKPAGELLVRTW